MNARRIVCIAMSLTSVACHGKNRDYVDPYLASADPNRGRAIIADHGCGACHTIPGVRGADGLVGPPLHWFSRRTFIAGELPNTPENLVRWVESPRSAVSSTAM